MQTASGSRKLAPVHPFVSCLANASVPDGNASRFFRASRLIAAIAAMSALLFFVFAPKPLYGQTATGSIVGTVTDTSGNVIVGANVTVTDVSTNGTRVTKTDSAGAYTVTFLKPATYDLSIESQGFQTFQQNGIILNVDAALTVDAKLPVGTVTQKVTVTGQPPLVEAQTSSIGQVMNTKTILDLPINGRNSYAFAALVPGVIPSAGFSQTAVDEYNDQFISINGARPNQSAFLLDGGVNTEPALSGPGFFTYGNAPRTIGNLLSPGLLNLDASVMKTFPISKVDFQLRFEGFNVFNHPQFGPPNTSWFPGAPGTTPTGQISFQQNAPRILQVAGKIVF